VFQTFSWNWHWCNHYLDGASELAVVIGRRGGRLVLVWPLVKQRASGMTQLAWMGEPVSQYGDALVEDDGDAPALLREAWRFICARLVPDLARLRKVREDAAVAPLLAEVGGVATQRLQAPYLDLASAKDFAAYEQRYSPRSRRNRRRLERRFQELGGKPVERHQEGRRARELAVEAIELKRAWLKDRGLVSPAVSDPRMARFFADVAEAAVRPAGCQVSVLAANDVPAALEIDLRCKDRVVMHVIVFNLAYEKSGAGVLLLEETIATSFGSGCRTFDLLAPADGYKLDWADGVANVVDWAVPLSLKGTIYARLYLGLARPAIKKGIAALPASLRRRVATGLS
jgi:CelD/BcsL family acetyltransferase involved in cellulose biosynthesis